MTVKNTMSSIALRHCLVKMCYLSNLEWRKCQVLNQRQRTDHQRVCEFLDTAGAHLTKHLTPKIFYILYGTYQNLRLMMFSEMGT